MYIVYKEKPVGNPILPDGSLLSATQCQEGWFILAEHKKYCDWTGGVEMDKITPIEAEV